MIRRQVWLGAILGALLALLGGCRGSQPSLCSDFLKIDKAISRLREAKSKDDFESVPGLLDNLAEVYEGIEPPTELREDWTILIEFFRRHAEAARILLRQGRAPETPAEEDARYDKAFTNITDYGVAKCGRVRGKLLP